MYDDIILQLIREFSEIFSEKSSTLRWNVENYKEELECSFQFRNLRSRVT